MISYAKNLDDNKTMSFKVDDNRLLKKYNKIQEKIGSLINIEFDSQPVFGDDDKYIKAKIKLYGNKVNKNFQSKKMLKENVSYKCLSLIMLDSAIKVNKNYYPKALLEECKYEIKKNKIVNLTDEDS